MRFIDVCNELMYFLKGECMLSSVKDCFSVYWETVSGKGDDSDNIARAEILQIAVEAYENGDFTTDDLKQTIVGCIR